MLKIIVSYRRRRKRNPQKTSSRWLYGDKRGNKKRDLNESFPLRSLLLILAEYPIVYLLLQGLGGRFNSCIFSIFSFSRCFVIRQLTRKIWECQTRREERDCKGKTPSNPCSKNEPICLCWSVSSERWISLLKKVTFFFFFFRSISIVCHRTDSWTCDGIDLSDNKHYSHQITYWNSSLMNRWFTANHSFVFCFEYLMQISCWHIPALSLAEPQTNKINILWLYFLQNTTTIYFCTTLSYRRRGDKHIFSRQLFIASFSSIEFCLPCVMLDYFPF